jgi:hypothetical protein
MRTALPWLGSALASILLGGLVHAQAPAPAAPTTPKTPAPAPGATYPGAGAPYAGAGMPYAGAGMPYGAPMGYPRPYPPRVAPDACGPGWWGVNCCGAPFGPNHCVYPPFPPYNGERPSMGGAPAFLPHPFARGPRDYFMLD